jgi:uncharacterized membrane protein YgcG
MKRSMFYILKKHESPRTPPSSEDEQLELALSSSTSGELSAAHLQIMFQRNRVSARLICLQCFLIARIRSSARTWSDFKAMFDARTGLCTHAVKYALLNNWSEQVVNVASFEQYFRTTGFSVDHFNGISEFLRVAYRRHREADVSRSRAVSSSSSGSGGGGTSSGGASPARSRPSASRGQSQRPHQSSNWRSGNPGHS